jgi:hypothetical protein
MPAAKPPEFRRRAVELARLREQPIAKIAKYLGITMSSRGCRAARTRTSSSVLRRRPLWICRRP